MALPVQRDFSPAGRPPPVVAADDGASSATNVVFSVGRFTLRVAADGRSDVEPTRSEVIAAAERLYRGPREL
jgi:hypothetical protein